MSYKSYSVPSQNSPRPIRTPRNNRHVYNSQSAREQYTVPNGPNWVHSSGSTRPIRFDFVRAWNEDIAREDETCGSSQEYYARKAQVVKPAPVPATRPTYVKDIRYLYPTQRTNLTFNFDRTTRADIDNMNTALPFGPIPTAQPKRKLITKKGIDKGGYFQQLLSPYI